MKAAVKSLASWTVRRDSIWRVLDATVLRVPRYLDDERRRLEASRRLNARLGVIETAIERVCPDLVVRHGAFAGMRYPTTRSIYSALFPKLLGSYEQELATFLDRILTREYTEIVDVGCAEGYYAIGLAGRFPNAIVYAYDTNVEALQLCRAMAELNGVADRVITGSFCDLSTFAAIPFRGAALVLLDCEGYERQLLSPEAVPLFERHDVLVEVHDFIDISISDHIRRTFSTTHHIDSVESLDDIKKARVYDFPELRAFDLPTRRVLLGEQRPAIMEWFLLSAASAQSAQRQRASAEQILEASDSLHRHQGATRS